MMETIDQSLCFNVKKDGTTLNVTLGMKLMATNAAALENELTQYCNQGIEKVVFNATGLCYLSSSGIRDILYAKQRLGGNPKIVFVNCPKEIHDVLQLVGYTTFIKFEESDEVRRQFRRDYIQNAEETEVKARSEYRKQTLDSFGSNNDVVCYSLKLGKNDENQ